MGLYDHRKLFNSALKPDLRDSSAYRDLQSSTSTCKSIDKYFPVGAEPQTLVAERILDIVGLKSEQLQRSRANQAKLPHFPLDPSGDQHVGSWVPGALSSGARMRPTRGLYAPWRTINPTRPKRTAPSQSSTTLEKDPRMITVQRVVGTPR